MTFNIHINLRLILNEYFSPNNRVNLNILHLIEIILF